MFKKIKEKNGALKGPGKLLRYVIAALVVLVLFWFGFKRFSFCSEILSLSKNGITEDSV